MPFLLERTDPYSTAIEDEVMNVFFYQKIRIFQPGLNLWEFKCISGAVINVSYTLGA